MKATKITCLTLATAMLASSCTTSYQAAGGLTGAMIGSHVGETIGALSSHGHFRGESAALGSLIGMGIGAILGVGIASQIEENERVRYEEYSNDVSHHTSTEQNSGNESPGYQIGGSAYNGMSTSAVLSISDLTYMDADGDGCISKGETIEVEGYITNSTKATLHNIVISMNVSDSKAFSTSPSLTTTLYPGQRIRYTGRVHCNRLRHNQSVGIGIGVEHAGKNSISNSLYVRTN